MLGPASVNAFKTYGGLGYFHGGATLQELVTPVVVARWPKKAHKIGVVLKPLGPIVRLNPTIEVAPHGVQRDLMGGVDETLTGRQVRVKIVHPPSGKVIFRSREAVPIEPGGPNRTVTLEKVPGAEEDQLPAPGGRRGRRRRGRARPGDRDPEGRAGRVVRNRAGGDAPCRTT